MGKLKFYIDESVNIAVASGLRRRGVEALSAREAGNLGLSDKEQIEYAIKNNFVIVTHDDDFLFLAEGFKHKGIVYVHQQKYSIGELLIMLKLLWEIADSKDMLNHIEFL